MSEFIFGKCGNRFFLVVFVVFLITWGLLQVPGGPWAPMFLWGTVAGALLALFGTPNTWEKHYRVWHGPALFATAFLAFQILCVANWKTANAFGAAAKKMRESLGATLGVGGDFGFQCIFMAAVALICLVCHYATRPGKVRDYY